MVLLVVGAIQNDELVAKHQIISVKVRLIVFQPFCLFIHTLIEGDVGDFIGPDVEAGVGHVVLELAEELARAVHTLVKIRDAPTHAIGNLAVRRSRIVYVIPAFHDATIGVVMISRSEHHIANLLRVHVLVTGHEDPHCAGNVRCRHGSTGLAAITRLTVGWFERIVAFGNAGILANDRGVNAIAGGGNSPPLAQTRFIETVHQGVLGIGRIKLVCFPEACNGNPVLFRLGIEIRIQRAIEGILHVAVACREDLHDVRALHCLPCGVDERLVRVCLSCGEFVTINLLEIEVLVFGFLHGIRCQMTSLHVALTVSRLLRNVSGRVLGRIFVRGDVVIPHPIFLFGTPLVNFLRSDVRTPGVVDYATAFCTIGSHESISHGLPTGMEEVMVLIRTIVVVVRCARIAAQNI